MISQGDINATFSEQTNEIAAVADTGVGKVIRDVETVVQHAAAKFSDISSATRQANEKKRLRPPI